MTVIFGRNDRFGEDVHSGGVGAYGGGVDPGAVVADAEVVDEVAGFEVVGAVEDEVSVEEGGGVGGDEVGDVGGDLDGGVDAGEVAVGGFGFGEGGAGVVFVEEHLALEVGGFYEIAVDEGEAAYAGAGEEAGGGGSGGAYSYDGYVGAGEELLAGGADGGEEDLAGVAIVLCEGVRKGVCVRGLGLGSGERRHRGSIRVARNLEGVGGGVANSAGAYCICKMKAMRNGRKPCVLRLCGDGSPQG